MKAIIEFKDLENMMRRVVKEVVQDEMMKLRASLLGYISEEEQKEIQKLYKKPSVDIAKTVEIDLK